MALSAYSSSRLSGPFFYSAISMYFILFYFFLPALFTGFRAPSVQYLLFGVHLSRGLVLAVRTRREEIFWSRFCWQTIDLAPPRRPHLNGMYTVPRTHSMAHPPHTHPTPQQHIRVPVYVWRDIWCTGGWCSATACFMVCYTALRIEIESSNSSLCRVFSWRRVFFTVFVPFTGIYIYYIYVFFSLYAYFSFYI